MAMDGRSDVLKVLLVEDSPADAELVVRALREFPRPVEHARVSSEESLRQALGEFEPHIILSDFSMPGFSGQEALQIAIEQVPATPFLFVSGTIGEELAIDALRRGAADYVLKDNLRRLPSAMERALRVAEERTARKRAEHALQESEERFRSIVESSLDWIWEIDRDGRMIYSNEAVEQILGYAPVELLGRNMRDLMHPQTHAEVIEETSRYLAEARGWRRRTLRCLHRDGTVRILISTGKPVLSSDGRVTGFRGTHHDDTERLAQESKIRQLARIHAVLSAVGNTVLRAANREELLVNACRIAVEQGGFKAAGIGRHWPDGTLRVAARYGDSRVLDVVAPDIPMPIHAPSPYHGHPGIRAFREKRKVAVQDFTASDLPVDLREEMHAIGIKSEIAFPLGVEPWGLLALFSGAAQDYDAEEIRLLERLANEIDHAVEFIEKSERLEYLAYHNPVTGMPNRTAFREQVAPLLARGPMLVAVLDVQRFAHINDSRGRAYGDELLRQVGLRLIQAMGPLALVAHPEADTFLLAYPATATPIEEVEQLDARILAIEHAPFIVNEEEIHVALLGGVALAPLHGVDGETLERNALAALAEAEKRKLHLLVFSDDLRGHAARRLELERDLRRAIDAEEFELHYQPKFEAASQRLIGAEALLRWRHPTAGLISPAEFIPVLEETGLIVPVGHWVVRQALATALRWRAEYHPSFRIAVNVSARELRHTRFLLEYRSVLEGAAADQPVDIEITESLLMDDVEHSIRLLEGLRDLGCRVSIDDFGTGYSSLNYLARLPADEIKLDQSFVALLTHSPETMGLVTNIISLAHSLSLHVVAEGVEEEEQAKLLRLLRCDALQGYLLGRPLPAAEFEKQLFAVT